MAEIEALELEITSNSNGATDALDRLTAALERLDKVTGKTTGLTQMNTRLTKLQSTLTNLTKSIVSVYAIRKVANLLGDFIGKSNDYVENMNLFTVSMGRFAEEAAEYANTVSDVMGIDPSTWIRNQGVFMTLATGFGVVEDRAYTMSKNLTQLGYDLSSFFNIEYSDAMTKLQAGLSGELEPLRRLGYDLSKAKLEAVALELGITKSYNAMTQAEKAQLRYYAIMTQVTEAQGDMARTLEQPANQIRVLQAQLEQCARAIGNIFIPALNAILPYAIAVVKVLREMAEYLAALAGFTLPEVEYDAGINSITDSAEEATEATNKLKKSLLGFDELNVLTKDTDTGAGAGGSEFSFDLPEYDFLGDAVNARVDEIVQKIKDAFAGIGDVAIPAFDHIGDTIVSAFTPAFDRIKEMLANTWDQIRALDWGSAFMGLGESLINALGSAASIVVNAFAPVWEALNVPAIVYEGINTLKAAFETLAKIFDALNPGITAFVENGIVAIAEWVSGIVIDALRRLQEGLDRIGDWFQKNEPVFTSLMETVGTNWGNAWSSIEPIFNLAWDWLKGVIEDIFSIAGEAIIGIAGGLDTVNGWVAEIWKKLEEKGVFEDLATIAKNAFESISGAIDTVKKTVEDLFAKLRESGAFDDIKKAFEGIGTVASGIFDVLIGIITGDWERTWNGFKTSIDGAKSVWENLKTAIDKILYNITYAIGELVGKIVLKLNTLKDKFSDLVKRVKSIFETGGWKNIGENIVNGIWNGIQSMWSGLKSWVSNAIGGLVDGVKDVLGIHSPSTVFIEIGEYTMEGMEVGIDKQTMSAENTMRDSMNRIVSSASSQSGRIANNTAVTIERNESGTSYDDSAAMAEQNALLREQNRIMEQLLRKESSVVISPSAALGRVVSQSQKQYAALAGG